MCWQMKKIELMIVFLFVSIVQSIIFHLQDLDSRTFAMGLPYQDGDFSLSIYVFILISPLIIMFFFFSDVLKDLTTGYGKLIIIRHYSKSKLLIKEVIKVFFYIVIFAFIQTVEAYFFKNQAALWDTNFQKTLIIYLSTIFTIVLLEMLIELHTESQYACLFVSIYMVVSYAMKGIASNAMVVRIVFFPSFLFNTMENEKEFLLTSIILTSIICVFIILNILKFKKTDIL
jgi:hypothetical protein